MMKQDLFVAVQDSFDFALDGYLRSKLIDFKYIDENFSSILDLIKLMKNDNIFKEFVTRKIVTAFISVDNNSDLRVIEFNKSQVFIDSIEVLNNEDNLDIYFSNITRFMFYLLNKCVLEFNDKDHIFYVLEVFKLMFKYLNLDSSWSSIQNAEDKVYLNTFSDGNIGINKGLSFKFEILKNDIKVEDPSLLFLLLIYIKFQYSFDVLNGECSWPNPNIDLNVNPGINPMLFPMAMMYTSFRLMIAFRIRH